MRLSEAIRLGSMLRPQCFRRLFDGARSCAIGAAVEAIGGGVCAADDWDMTKNDALGLTETVFPLLNSSVECPVCERCALYPNDLRAAIECLNDTHRWTRERIADWVESVEREREAKTAAVETEVLA